MESTEKAVITSKLIHDELGESQIAYFARQVYNSHGA